MSDHRAVASRHVSRVIHADPAEVYAYAADVDNLPRWAAGLASGEITRTGDTLAVDSPMGIVRVRFVPRNELGVLDHEVTLPTGTTVFNPMRIMPHPDGAEVIFTVRQIELTDDEFDRDVQAVADDLARLDACVTS